MPPLSVGDRKQALRREIRVAARQFPAESARTASRSIRDHLKKWITDSSAKVERPLTIALFAALTGEPDLLPLIPAHPRIRWVMPRVSGDELKWHLVKALEDLAPGTFGISEPDPAVSKEIDGAEIEAFLVPGMAFDPQSGNRLGRGKGYYDRTLAAADPKGGIIGVGFEWQIRPDLPAESHDRPVNAIVTESGLRWIARNEPLSA